MFVRFCSAILLLLTACTVGPKYESAPPIELPQQWQNASKDELENKLPDDFVWWQELRDPILDALIQTAATQNLDLGIAGLHILEARREQEGATSERYPHIDASLTGGQLHCNNKQLMRAISGCGQREGHRVNFFEAGFDVSWEIDLFGALEHETQALQAKLESIEENFSDVWITLAAEVARGYVELRLLQQRRQILNESIASQQETLILTRDLLKIGMANAIDSLQLEEQLSRLTAERPSLDLAIDKAIYRLSVLLGESPSAKYEELIIANALPYLPCEFPVGIPSDLLRRRPDIRKAERELAAATETVGAAVASLFPRLKFLGFVGDVQTQLKHTDGGLLWFAAPQLLLPIFNSRMLTQDVAINKIRAQQALFNYQKTVLASLEEVEAALASYRYEWERNQILRRALQQSQEAYFLASDLQQRGLKDFIELLTLNRAHLLAKESLLQSDAALLIHFISLYKALGGAWDLSLCDEPR